MGVRCIVWDEIWQSLSTKHHVMFPAAVGQPSGMARLHTEEAAVA